MERGLSAALPEITERVDMFKPVSQRDNCCELYGCGVDVAVLSVGPASRIKFPRRKYRMWVCHGGTFHCSHNRGVRRAGLVFPRLNIAGLHVGIASLILDPTELVSMSLASLDRASRQHVVVDGGLRHEPRLDAIDVSSQPQIGAWFESRSVYRASSIYYS